MTISDIDRYARLLHEALGEAAEATAEARLRAARSFGDSAGAREWTRIRNAIRDLQSAAA